MVTHELFTVVGALRWYGSVVLGAGWLLRGCGREVVVYVCLYALVVFGVFVVLCCVWGW